MKILVTGGCGFIGSNFIRHMFKVHADGVSIVNLDKLTYAGRPENLSGVDTPPRYRFVHGDIDWRRVRTGLLVWKTNDPALDRDVRASFTGDQIRFFLRLRYSRCQDTRQSPLSARGAYSEGVIGFFNVEELFYLIKQGRRVVIGPTAEIEPSFQGYGKGHRPEHGKQPHENKRVMRR